MDLQNYCIRAIAQVLGSAQSIITSSVHACAHNKLEDGVRHRARGGDATRTEPTKRSCVLFLRSLPFLAEWLQQKLQLAVSSGSAQQDGCLGLYPLAARCNRRSHHQPIVQSSGRAVANGRLSRAPARYPAKHYLHSLRSTVLHVRFEATVACVLVVLFVLQLSVVFYCYWVDLKTCKKYQKIYSIAIQNQPNNENQINVIL